MSDISLYIDSLEFIPIIENDNNSYISEISKILIDSNGNYIILDRSSNIKMFDINGKFINNIGNKGRGPGEYIYVNDICLDEKKSSLFALQNRNIIKFSLSDKKFVEKIDIPAKNFDAIAPSNNGSFFLFSSNPASPDDFLVPFYAISHIDKKGEQIEELLPRQDFVFTQSIFTQSFDGSYIMRPQEGDNTVYKFKDGCIMPIFKIDFKDLAIPGKYKFTTVIF